MLKYIPALFFFLFGVQSLFAQSTKVVAYPEQQQVAMQYLSSHLEHLQLSPQDVQEVQVTDAFQDRHNGLTHIWMQQYHNGIPVYNGLIGLHIDKQGKVWETGHRFVQNLAGNAKTALPSLSAFQALEIAQKVAGINHAGIPSLKQKVTDKKWIFEGGDVARSDIKVDAVYFPMEDGTVRLAWQAYLHKKEGSDILAITIDAQTGALLEKFNHTLYCSVEKTKANIKLPFDQNQMTTEAQCDVLNHSHAHTNTPDTHQHAVAGASGATYRAFAFPVESPVHGNQTLLVNPADLTASPYGWHDINGAQGAEYNYTRGNNVYAYSDDDNNNQPPSGVPSPSGGSLTGPLVFDWPYDYSKEADTQPEAALTNLFYANNAIHDIMYGFGFDETAGNFQVNNYGRGGLGSDAVQAEGFDSGGTDNANFSTPADGNPGRMQMYKWTRGSGEVVRVNGPAAIGGTFEATVTNWGAPITNTAFTGDAVIVDDGTDIPTLGCSAASQQNLTGKIALIDRGICQFSTKAFNAQERGAIGCIICNFEDNLPPLGAGTQAGQVTIPVVGLKKKDCDLLRQYSGNGLNISLVKPAVTGPEFYDGQVDNGIVIHEYFHGISNRLTGGPSAATCLNNAEQMGEGWSDWGTLILTTKPGDTPQKRRGIGTFVQRQSPDGQGIRRYVYTTDMSLNPLTFASVAENTEVHALGEVWTAVTWDLYWAFVEKYGFDADLKNKNSGNARAIQHIMDGMKLQPCRPGFIDGRNSIMTVNKINYAGVDTCLISKVFARRGFGIGASQGSSANAGDGVQDFEPIPTCIQEIKLKKTITSTIQPGGEATVTLTVTNHKPNGSTGVVLKDHFGAGLSYVAGSANAGGIGAAGQVTWDIGNMAFGEVRTFTYKLKNDPNFRSLLLYADPMDKDDNWLPEGTNIYFGLQSNDVKTGTGAFFAASVATQEDGKLEMINPFKVTGNKPVLRFWTKYETEAGTDGGWVEVSSNGGSSWQRLRLSKSIRNGYTGNIPYSTIAIPFLEGFSGNSNGWVQSYLDLSDFKNKDILVRYRKACNNSIAGKGWWIDQTELLDLLNYDEDAVITSAQGDSVRAKAPNAGLIVDTNGIVPNKDIADPVDVTVFPNPAHDLVMVAFGRELKGNTQVNLLAADGRLVQTRKFEQVSAGQITQFDVMPLVSGVYFVQIVSGDSVITTKIAKH